MQSSIRASALCSLQRAAVCCNMLQRCALISPVPYRVLLSHETHQFLPEKYDSTQILLFFFGSIPRNAIKSWSFWELSRQFLPKNMILLKYCYSFSDHLQEMQPKVGHFGS